MLTSYFTVPQQAAIGQYITLKQLFKSDQILTGEVLKFRPDIFSSQLVPANEPTSYGFQILYPPVAGLYDFTNINSKNYKAVLKVIDGSNFEIQYSFFVTRPNALNSNAFNSGSFSGSVSFFCKIDGDTERAIMQLEVSGFWDDQIEFIESGFIPGEDLKVNFKVLGTTNNNFFVGLIKEDAVSNSVAIVPGLVSNYARINFGANQVDDLPYNCFSAGFGFQESLGESIGGITVLGACLHAGSSYKVYIVYYKDGKWKSCISSSIVQTATNAPIVPIGTFVSTDVFGNVGENCLTGLSPDTYTAFNYTLNTADFNAQLTARGLVGIWSDYFVSAKAFETTTSGSFTGRPLVLIGTAPVFTVDDFKPSSGGQKFVIIQLRFDYPTHSDFVNVVFDFNYNAITIPLSIEVNNGVGEMCSGETYAITGATGGQLLSSFTSDCEVYQSVNGSALVPNTILSGLNINLAQIPMNGIACFKAICTDGVTSLPDPASCDKLITQAWWSEGFGRQATYFGFAGFDGPVTWEAVMTPIFNPNPTFIMPLLAGTEEDFFEIDVRLVEYITSLTIYVTRNDCVYVLANAHLLLLPVAIDYHTVTTDCDCGNTVQTCLNYASINYECDQETGEVTISVNDNFESTVDSFELLCSVDGGLTFIPCPATIIGAENIFITYDISFTDGCIPIHVEQVVQCITIPYDINGREIALTYNAGTLAIAVTNNFASTPLSDKLFVSINNGETFIEYNLLTTGYSPISLVGNEKIIVYSETIFEDGHIDLFVNKKLDLTLTVGVCAGYVGYTLASVYNELNSTFTVTKGGDESLLTTNQLLWTIGGGNPFDSNMSGIPYSSAVSGEGIFIARWKIKKINCPELILDVMAWGKSDCLPISICNWDEMPIRNILQDRFMNGIGTEFILTNINLTNVNDFDLQLQVLRNGNNSVQYVAGNPTEPFQYTVNLATNKIILSPDFPLDTENLIINFKYN